MDGGPPCKTLNYAFLGVIDDTTLQIGTGTFPLENSTVLTGIQNVVISGMGEDPGSTIQCSYDKPGGLKFERCTNLTIAGIRNILNCGVLQDTTCIFGGENFTTPSPSALFFHNCTDVSMTDVTVRNSNGTGVTMYSVIGTVTVQSCEFTENQIQNDTEHASGGTGLYIEFPNCPPGVSTCESPDNVNAQYVISNCTFSFNTATVTNTYQHSFSVENGTSHVAFGRGGGLSVFFAGKASNNMVTVQGSNFTDNRAVWGGGLFVQFQDRARDNHLAVNNCSFEGNSLAYDVTQRTGTGGGGARIGYIFYESGLVMGNSMSFDTCVFRNNRAYWGGGVSYTAPREDGQTASNKLEFHSCWWIENTARLGSAIDLDAYHPIVEGKLASVVFDNCEFWNNSYYYYFENNQLIAWQYLLGRGTLYTDSIPVQLINSVTFYNCSGTALASFTAPIYIGNNTNVGFERNYGVEGGGIALLGDAVMVIGENAKLMFKNNQADRLGGAIYAVNLGDHELVASRNCFIRYYDTMKHPSKWNASFSFENNRAGLYGQSIYTTSLLPCLWGSDGNSLNTSLPANKHVFRWSTAFQYNNCSSDNFTVEWDCSEHEVASDLSAVTMVDEDDIQNITDDVPYPATKVLNFTEPVVKFAPGNFVTLPFDLFDDLHNEVNTVFYARITCDEWIYDANGTDCDIHVDKITKYSSFLTVAIHGNPVGTATDPRKLPTLTLNSIGSLEYQICVRVNLTCCPPGLYQSGTECVCGDGGLGKIGNIVSCDMSRFEGRLKSNHWAGYFNSREQYDSSVQCNQRTLYTSICPPQYCKTDSTPHDQFGTIPLDVEASNDQLSEKLCANRTNVLCGECLPGYTVSINEFGNGAKCIDCKHSPIPVSIAWLVWFLTEILPITILVIAFLLFDFKILKGPLNAFMLYAQVIGFFGLYAFGELNLLRNSSWYPLINIYEWLYNFWNLDFLSRLLPDFCLAEEMNTFHVYMIRYGIALYPFLLLAVFYTCRGCFTRFPLCNRAVIRIQQVFVRWQRLWKTRSNVLNGLAALMVLSYSKITAVSFTILASTQLVSKDSQISVVRFQGSWRPFDEHHLPYALVALVFIATIVTIPPVLLIFYPLVPIVYEKCNLGRFKLFSLFNRWSSRFLVNGFLPPFYGCYKEKFTFFAGLMFIARIAYLASFAVAWNIDTLLVWNIFISLALLMVHSVCQPYKERWHNILDAFIYSIMLLINVLSLYSLYVFTESGSVHVPAFYVQLLLIYSPLVFLVGWIGYSLYHAFCKCYRSGREYKGHIQRANSHLKRTSRVMSNEDVTGSSVTDGPRSSSGARHLMREELLDYDIESSGSFWERERLVQSKSRHSDQKNYNSITNSSVNVSESVMAIHD